MAKTRNSKNCDDCGGVLKAVEGDEEGSPSRCHKCWGLLVASLEDRVKELEPKGSEGGEEEPDIFKDCCECDELRAKIVELEKKVVEDRNKVGGVREELDGGPSSENGVMLEEMVGIRISNEKLKFNTDDLSKKLAVKAVIIENLDKVIDKLRSEKVAFELQLEEFRKFNEELVQKMKDMSLSPTDQSVVHVKGRVNGDAHRDMGNYREKSLGERPLKEVQPGGQGGRRSFSYSDVVKVNQGNRNSREIVSNRRSMTPGASDQQGNWGFFRDNVSQGKNSGRQGVGSDKIMVIGDSMIKYVDRIVGLNQHGSFKRSIGGAGIKQIMGEAIEAAENTSGGAKLFIQGGGNSLKFIGVDQTVDSVLEGVREIHKRNKDICTVVLSIAPRPKENGLYNRNRELTNRILMEEIRKLYQEGIKVTFINMDVCLDSDCFVQDGVHFNFKGNGALGKVIISALKRVTNRSNSRN